MNTLRVIIAATIATLLDKLLITRSILMVPGAGIEPARPLSRGILSPLRLPISPPGLDTGWSLSLPYS